MPYISEHALRLENPDKYIKYRRTQGGIIYGSIKIPKTISIIWGHSKGEPKDAFHPQALRFPIKDWTEKQSKNWISKNIKNYISFEPANPIKQEFSMNILERVKQLPIFKIIPTAIKGNFCEIAITDSPAIEEFFLKFDDKEEIKLEFNTDKKIITGAVMTPNKLVYRNDALGERFVTYDEESIQLAASLFMKNGLKFNSEHTTELLPIDIIESYFTTTNDNKFNVPIGSWIVSAKVNDDELWDKLKNNNMGFSIQSLFINELIGTEQLNFNNNKQEEEKMDLKEKLMNAVNAVLFGETQIEMAATPDASGSPVVEEPKVEDKPAEETPVAPTVDEVKQLIADALGVMVEEIMSEVESKIAEALSGQEAKMVEMSTQLEEFSKQPLSQPVTEVAENTSKLTTNSKYAYLEGMNK